MHLFIQLFRSLFAFIFPLFGQQMFNTLGLGGGNSVCLFPAFFWVLFFQLNQIHYVQKLLAGLAIILGIPFPIWIYYNGEKLRARNPLTQASTIPKKRFSQWGGMDQLLLFTIMPLCFCHFTHPHETIWYFQEISQEAHYVQQLCIITRALH